MQTVNMQQAKSSLSRLVEAIEQGEEREIIIARIDGLPPNWYQSQNYRRGNDLGWLKACLKSLTRSMAVMQR